MYITSESDCDRLANEVKDFLKHTEKPVVVEWKVREIDGELNEI